MQHRSMQINTVARWVLKSCWLLQFLLSNFTLREPNGFLISLLILKF